MIIYFNSIYSNFVMSKKNLSKHYFPIFWNVSQIVAYMCITFTSSNICCNILTQPKSRSYTALLHGWPLSQSTFLFSFPISVNFHVVTIDGISQKLLILYIYCWTRHSNNNVTKSEIYKINSDLNNSFAELDWILNHKF